MNDRERILALLSGKQPDRVPWFGDLAYWAYARVLKNEAPHDFFTHPSYMDWHRELGVGFYLQGYEPYRLQCRGGVEIKHRDEGDLRINEIVTPRGTLREVWKFLPISYTIAPMEHFVKGPADLPALRYYLENIDFAPHYEIAHQRQEWVQDLGLVLCYTPRSPLMQMTVQYAGVPATIDLWMQDPLGFTELLELIARQIEPALRLALESPADCLMIPENLSSEVVGKSLFEMYLRPYQEEWVARIRKSGKFSFIHMDGTIKGLLREEASVGFNVLEALTPMPVGDLSIQDWEATADNVQSVLWGGLPGSYLTAHVSEEEFERHLREVLAVMRRAPRYVLGVADQVPPDVIPDRVRAVRRIVEEDGIY